MGTTPAEVANPAGGPHAGAEPREVLSTHMYPRRADWTGRVDAIDASRFSRLGLIREILRRSHGYRVVVLDGSIPLPYSPDMIAAMLLAFRRRRPAVILTECNWKSATGAMRLARRIGMRIVDRAVTRYGVYTSAEVQDFARRWSVDPGKVRFTPYYYNLTDEELGQPPLPLVPGGIVFAGGNSLRDYRTLVRAAEGLPAQVRICTTREVPGDAPGNVTIGPVPHEEYMRLAREAAVNVVPMQPGLERCAGLETYVSAMAMGKLTIVSDTPGVHDYIEHERTGLIVPAGDPDALREAIAWAVDPANAARVEEIAMAGRRAARERFGPEHYTAALLAMVDEALAAA